MNQSITRHPRTLALARAGLASVLAIVLLGATASWVVAQTDDFNSGTDTAWTHYSLPNVPSFGYYGAASYSFPPDGSGGKAYRIFAPGITNDPIGLANARAGSYRTNIYGARFVVGADLLAWNADWKQEAGLLFHASDINLGTTMGYAATYSSGYRQMYISRITSEVPTTVAELGTGAFTADPTHRYRLVASSHEGITLLFQMFDQAEPNNPVISCVGYDGTYLQGACGIFVFEQNTPPSPQGADATYDNYAAFEPAAGTLAAEITDLYPWPAAKATQLYPTNTVAILNRDTAVDVNSVALCLDGTWIPSGSLTRDPLVHKPENGTFQQDFPGATVTYPIPTLFPPGSKHTNIVAYLDSANTWRTNTWTWTTAYPYLSAANSLPLGSLTVRGFDVRMVQSVNGGTNLDNSLARARQQLAIPPQIPVDNSATCTVQVLNWDKSQAPPNNVPGLCPGSSNNIAVESTAYLELTAGLHRFRVNTDDRAGVYSGPNLSEANAVVLWENPGDTANATFDFYVEAAGLYPVNCLWEETGGGAHLALSEVNLNDLTEVLINDPANTAAVKAWYPIVCKSSSAVAGPYALATAAVNAPAMVDVVSSDCSPTVVGQMVTGGTFTVPVSGAAQFYYVDAPRKTKITSFAKGASNVTITYQVQ